MKLLTKIVSLCTAGVLVFGVTGDIPSKIHANESGISIKNPQTVTAEELMAEKDYLLNKEHVGFSNPEDYNGDGVINVFDMIELRRMMADSEVSIDEFDIDLFNVHINETETATFTAAVDSYVELEENAISVYDADNNFITYLNDNGENGDEFADDGVYSGQADVCSDTRKIVQYYAATDKAKSNTAEINFWTEFTEEEINNFNEILSETKGKSFDEVNSYLKECENIKEITIDEEKQTIIYTTTAGISCIWGKLSDTYKGTAQADAMYNIDFDKYDIEMKGADAEQISTDAGVYVNEIINNPEIKVVHPDKTNVVVIQPFKDEFYDNETSISDVTGDLLAKALQKDENATAEKVINEEVTLDYLMTLMDDETIGAVLFDCHGAFDGTNFLLTGHKVKKNADSSLDEDADIEAKFDIDPEYSADVQGQLVYIFDSPDKEGKYRYSINGNFFREHYKDKKENVKNTFWFLGACNSIQKKLGIKGEKISYYPLADGLINVGADAVIGYTDTVDLNYDRRVLCEFIINNMILNQSTVSDAIEKTKKTWADNFNSYLKNDSAFNEKEEVAEITYKGDSGFKFLENGYGDFKYRITTENVKSDYPKFPIYYGNVLIYKKIKPVASIKERRLGYKKYLNFYDYTVGSYPDIYYEDENNIYKFYGNHESDQTDDVDVVGSLTLPIGDYMFLANSGLPSMQYYYPPNDSELINTIEQTEYHVSYDMADIDNPSDKYYTTIKKDDTKYKKFNVRTDVKYEFSGVPGLGSD